MPTHVSPARNLGAFNCPRCGAYAHQEWTTLKREYRDEDGQPFTQDASDGPVSFWAHLPASVASPDTSEGDAEKATATWAQAECAKCNYYSTWRDDRLVYPNAVPGVPPAHDDMPEDVAELYREAAEVSAISRRAGTALARATLERLVKALRPQDAGDLAKRLEALEPLVSAPLGEMLLVIRHTGNKSLHVEDAPDEATVLVLDPEDADTIALMFAAINDLVDELIAKPARTRALYERVPERVRQQRDALVADRDAGPTQE